MSTAQVHTERESPKKDGISMPLTRGISFGGGLFVEDVALVDFIYFICLFTRVPGESYRGKFRSVAEGFKVLLSFLPLGARKQSYIPTIHSS